MNKKEKADARNIGSKNPFDYFADNQRLFDFDYAEKQETLQSNLQAHLERNRKVIRLYRCFACERNRTAQKMSSCLAVCRECYRTAQSKGVIAKRNFVERTLNNFHKFLRGRV
jgi:DNA-directed RNA polymerase sigma subunit (sigma70/sigma32)